MIRSGNHLLYLGATILLCFNLPDSASAENISVLSPQKAEQWVITIGNSAIIGPSYEGARSANVYDRPYHLNLIPSLNWRHESEKSDFSAPDDSMDFTVFNQNQFRTGLVVNIRSGRYHGSDVQLKGLNNVKWTLEGGGFAEYWPVEDHLRVRAELRHGLLRSNTGFIADISGDWVEKISQFTLSAGPRLSLANTTFMTRNFGVSEIEAVKNGRINAFTPLGGLKSTGLSTAVSYEWNKSVTTSIFQRYDRLTNDAAKSPITSVLGQRNQYSIGASLNYSFRL